MKTNFIYGEKSVLSPLSPRKLSGFLLIPVILLGLAACAPPVNNMEGGNLTIVLSQGNEGRALDPDILKKLIYDMDLSGPGRISINLVTDPGVEYVTVSVVPGKWTVRVKAYLENELFGTGELAFTVGNGGSNSVMIPMRRSAAAITAFGFEGLDSPAEVHINGETNTVAVTVPPGTSLTSLVPAISVSPGASITRTSPGAASDFSDPVTYTVTAANKTSAEWTVRVTAALPKNIVSFSVTDLSAAGDIDWAEQTVTVTVPYGTSLTNLAPAIEVSDGASIEPASGTAQNFSGSVTNPVIYTVTAADGSTATWRVTVTNAAPGSAKEITAFGFDGFTPPVTGDIDPDEKTVAVTVPYGTILASLTPTIAVSPGASITRTSPGAASDFSAPVTYTVTAEDGTTAAWKVTVNRRPLASVTEIGNALASPPAGMGTGSVTEPVYLPVALNLSSDWASLLDKIGGAGKFVALDLSACTMTLGGIVSTEFDPGAANTGESKIVSLVLPDGATSIKAGTFLIETFTLDSTFKNFTALKSVEGDNVVTVGNVAFTSCTTLESVSFPAAASIGDYAFAACALTMVDFPKAISIGDLAFYGCTGLAMADFPLVTNLGNSVFQGCAALTTASLPLVTSLGSNVFQGCTALRTVSLPEATGIDSGAFSGCTALMTANLPLVTSLGNNAFQGCIALAAADFPLAERIGNAAFEGCAALSMVDFPKVASRVGTGAFKGCTALTMANLPLADSIGYYAFSGCTALTTAYFPKASIGYDAFANTGTKDLTVTLGNEAPMMGTNLFNGVTSPKTVTVKVPAGATGYAVTLPATYSGADTTDNWGNAFRGKGWGPFYLTGTVNENIMLNIVEYTP